MKTIIAGSRTITDLKLLEEAISYSNFKITEVVYGCASGVDLLGKIWAQANNITISTFPADWNKYGKKAGMIRNQEMADYAEALIAIWDGPSKGTLDMIKKAKKNKILTAVFIFDSSKDRFVARSVDVVVNLPPDLF